jgi:hypothetical protein
MDGRSRGTAGPRQSWARAELGWDSNALEIGPEDPYSAPTTSDQGAGPSGTKLAGQRKSRSECQVPECTKYPEKTYYKVRTAAAVTSLLRPVHPVP